MIINTVNAVGQTFSHEVTSGPLIIGALCALLAGLVSFFSPCVIPLIPGYLSYLSSLVTEGDETKKTRWRTVNATLCFILGFTIVFLLGSVTIFGAISLVIIHHRLIQIIGGMITMLMAGIFLGFFRPAQTTKRLAIPHFTGLFGAIVLGAIFSLSWTPCLGPTLSSVLALNAGTAGLTAVRGIIMVCFYCLGLGLPFLFSAWGSHWAIGAINWLKKYMRAIHLISGIILFLIGLALTCGQWDDIVEWIRQQWISNWNLPV